MGAVAAVGRIVNLFINGEYRGHYNPCARLEEEFFQEWYGSDEDWDVITDRWYNDSGIRDGDNVALYDMLDYVRGHDLSDNAFYQEAGRRLDLVNFIDYLIVQLYSGNGDWPNNNWVVARERSDSGRFIFLVHDIEAGMEPRALHQVGFNEFSWHQPEGGKGLNGEDTPLAWIYRALKANGDFRLLFADRIKKHFYNDGALTNANLAARFLELRDDLSMVFNEIFGMEMDTYILDTWIPERRDVMLNAFTEEGLGDY